jgi:phospholipase D1/2
MIVSSTYSLDHIVLILQIVHSKVEGNAAFDVLINFEQRWKKNQDSLLLGNVPTYIDRFKDENSWEIQVFRSCDSDTLDMSDDNPYAVYPRIQQAYIRCIKNADRFIYIENQYFAGSSFCFEDCADDGLDNRVPYTMVERICHKIRKQEDFAIFIVIPMFPDGFEAPENIAAQEQLHWQFLTMQFMYKRIAEELKANNIENKKPTDYLKFFCLGTRQKCPDVETKLEQVKELGTEDCPQYKLLKNQRSQIYVHSKLMIVDDEYLIVGSGNLNERSLAGDRDSEICVGAFQPHVGNDRAIQRFREQLFTEHLGNAPSSNTNIDWNNPMNEETQKYIDTISQENWYAFSDDSEFRSMHSHLMKYPIVVSESGDGSISPIQQYFPDSRGKIKGQYSVLFPDILTQ